MNTEDFAAQLVRDARAQRGSSPSCVPSGRAPKIATATCAGWSFVLDVYDHPGADSEIEHFRLSAKLSPPGRGSNEQDWNTLGTLTAAILRATGRGNWPPPSPILPLEETRPNDAIHWMWHSDGSEVEPLLIEEMARVLRAVQNAISAAAKPPAQPGRNAPCPCGSGRKFKKCHGEN